MKLNKHTIVIYDVCGLETVEYDLEDLVRQTISGDAICAMHKMGRVEASEAPEGVQSFFNLEDGKDLPVPTEEEIPEDCECDNTHKQNDTVCRWCWAHGRRKWDDLPVRICDECGNSIPEIPEGSLTNKHHKESCSLFDATKE